MDNDQKINVVCSWSSSGIYTFTVPDDVTEITVEISGGGAGGRGANWVAGSSSVGESSGGESGGAN